MIEFRNRSDVLERVRDGQWMGEVELGDNSYLSRNQFEHLYFEWTREGGKYRILKGFRGGQPGMITSTTSAANFPSIHCLYSYHDPKEFRRRRFKLKGFKKEPPLCSEN
ncbi:hypothetical protein BY996DRAFT_6488316 [Phakopsora pachyrhizi]|uniref:Uncharacterized protein n=1 Tax=Phakopsora pachyrhizi TaxID=170000 RepID=A0AAV0AQU0_PHAPC|nr:hypothetical protein BY996DRAFT_6488316 [Phakopsora pachyrhizi]CAH7671604.1 hypothetical protein PPACK8108_LOCUS6397 [Phakopsora pachyrhizi]